MFYSEDEVLTPVESKEYPGFYVVPGYWWVVVSRDGACINARTGNHLAHNKVKGYRQLNTEMTVARGSGEYLDLKAQVHRLLALTFIGRPAHLRHIPFSSLQANHIDHDRWNCSLENLEWVTGSRNVQAATEFGAIAGASKVLARDIRTNEVQIFAATIRCARHFDLHVVDLRSHLAGPEVGRRTHDWHVFKLDDGLPWPVLPIEDQVETKWYHTGFVSIVSEDKSKSFVFNTLKEVVEFLGVDRSALRYYRERNGPVKPYRGWIITIYDTVLGHDTSMLATLTAHFGGRRNKRRIRVTNVYTDIRTVFSSISDAAKTCTVSESTIREAIANSRVFAAQYKAEFVDS
jgi:hypothetical protein